MNKTAVLVLALVFILSACMPLPFVGQATATPVIDRHLTDEALAATLAAETLNALPTPTLVVAIDSPDPTATFTIPPTATVVASETATPAFDLTATVTTTFTDTASTIGQVNAIATETLHPRFYGTLPPAIPFGKVALINRAKVEIYVSLQCKTIDGYRTILEYPVYGRVRVSAPAGSYTYVAWVGGRQFKGSFHLDKGEDLSMTFYKDKVTLK